MVASTVSSKMLKIMGEKNNFKFEETLTGFKWISNKGIDLEKEGFELLLSYEEAIGYSIGDIVRDKDGVCAAANFAELYATLCKRDINFTQYLELIYQK